MAENSKIEWTDHTVNLWWGCQRVHAGCDNCYAADLAKRFGKDVWDETNENTGKLDRKPRQIVKSAFKDLLKYQRKAEAANEHHKVFIGSMMDIFEKSKPLVYDNGEKVTTHSAVSPSGAHQKETGDLRKELFQMIDSNCFPNLIFLFLTKRPSNIRKMVPEHWLTEPFAPSNVWFGASVVDNESMRSVSQQLFLVPGPTFWSVEPLLEKLEVGKMLDEFYANQMLQFNVPHWVICGGESGPKKRPFDLEWHRALRQDCAVWGDSVPYFFKQIDKVTPIPEHEMIREFPNFNTGA
jgi:protein gp37